MLENIKIENILFLDIETVPQYPSYDDLPEKWKKLWDKKAQKIAKNNETPRQLYPRAGIYAEFGKIITISTAYISKTKENSEQLFLIVKSFFGDDEKKILKDFFDYLKKEFTDEFHLCAHNGKEFDFPYISRRALVNGLKLPDVFANYGKKPWEVKFLDTMDLWRFGDYKSYTSLELLTATFDIPTPKDDIDGSEVWKIYWQDKDLDRIVKYCQKDVIAVVQLFLKYKNKPLIKEENIIYL